MPEQNSSNRRDFVKASGTASMSLLAGASLIARADDDKPKTKLDPDEILKNLMEGNSRFMAGKTSLLTRRRPEDFARLAEGQAPPSALGALPMSRTRLTIKALLYKMM